MQSSAHSNVMIPESVVCANLDNEAILLNVNSGIYYGVDSVGTAIWSLLSKGLQESEIFDHLLETYDVDPLRLRADIFEFLELLSARGLLRVGDGSVATFRCAAR